MPSPSDNINWAEMLRPIGVKTSKVYVCDDIVYGWEYLAGSEPDDYVRHLRLPMCQGSVMWPTESVYVVGDAGWKAERWAAEFDKVATTIDSERFHVAVPGLMRQLAAYIRHNAGIEAVLRVVVPQLPSYLRIEDAVRVGHEDGHEYCTDIDWKFCWEGHDIEIGLSVVDHKVDSVRARFGAEGLVRTASIFDYGSTERAITAALTESIDAVANSILDRVLHQRDWGSTWNLVWGSPDPNNNNPYITAANSKDQ